jgi:hypothetical protein
MLTQEEPVRSKTPWTDIVEAKRAIRSQHIKTHRQDTGNSEIGDKITRISDISALMQLLESREVSAEDIVTAYIQKCVYTDSYVLGFLLTSPRACIAHEKV